MFHGEGVNERVDVLANMVSFTINVGDDGSALWHFGRVGPFFKWFMDLGQDVEDSGTWDSRAK